MITIQQNDKLTLSISGDVNRSIALPIGIQKTSDGIRITSTQNAGLEDIKSADVTSITDSAGSTTPINGDTDLLYNTLISDFFFNIRGSSGGGSGEFLSKTTLDPQTVAGSVEFLQDITVPSGSVILGKDGARLSSAGRSLHYTDARELATLYTEYHYDDTGSEVPHYLEWGALQTNFPVNPDDDGTVLSTSNMAFVGALGASATLAFYVKPLTQGVLRLQMWEGSDDTGAVLIDTLFNVTGIHQNTISKFEFPVPLITAAGDLQFVRFTGVDLSGAVQTAGAFIGELQPFMEFDVQLLTQKDLATSDDLTGLVDEAPEDGKQYARKDAGWAEVEGDGIGDMLKATYDPNTVEGDAFDMDNMVEGANTKIMTDAERTNLGNQSGTNTGDQDLSGKQDILSEGAFVDGDKTKLDNQSGTNTGDQDISGKADRDGDDLTNATVNGVNFQTNLGKFVFLDGNGDYTSPEPAFGELRRSTDGNQSLGTTISKLDFNQNGGSNFTTADVVNNRITVNNAASYRIELHGSVILKRDAMHEIYYRINSDVLTDEQIICAEVPEDNYCWPLSGSKTLDLAANDYIELWAWCQSTKDFKMQEGTTFTVTRI